MFRRPASLRRVAVDHSLSLLHEKASPSLRYYPDAKTSSRPSRRAPFFFALAVPRLRRRFAPSRQPTRCCRAGVLLWAATLCAADPPWKWLDLPSSRGNPCRRAHAPSTPEEPDGTRLVAPPDTATVTGTSVASSTGLSRLNRMARRLAVYASPWRLPDTTQDSLAAAWLRALPRGTFTRWVSLRKVSDMCQNHMSFSFRELAWRNPVLWFPKSREPKGSVSIQESPLNHFDASDSITTRKPAVLPENPLGLTLNRLAERHSLGWVSQDPPRITRKSPVAGPVGSVTASLGYSP
jgi:hypothetical protein